MHIAAFELQGLKSLVPKMRRLAYPFRRLPSDHQEGSGRVINRNVRYTDVVAISFRHMYAKAKSLREMQSGERLDDASGGWYGSTNSRAACQKVT